MDRLGAFLAASLLAACSAAPPGIYLPTYGFLNGLPTALVEGTLVEEHGCLWIEGHGTRWLVLWPPGTVAYEADGTLQVRSGGASAAVGTRVSAGGGEYGPEHYDFVVELIGEEVPPACRESGHYWLTGGVEPAGS